MRTIRRIDPFVEHQYMVASVLASMMVRKTEIETESAELAAIVARNERRKEWLSVAALLLAVSLILWPLACRGGEVAQPRIPRIIYFGASWCAPCREALHGKDNFPDWLTAAGWQINGSDQAHIQVVDIDERNDLMELYRVKTVPCMVIVTDKGGSEPIPYTGRASIAAAIKRAWK